MSAIHRFLTDDEGTTAVEYAVMLSLILLTAIGSVSLFGSSQGNKWGSIQSNLKDHGI